MTAGFTLLLVQSCALLSGASDSVFARAESFAVLSAGGVSNTGDSKVFGDPGAASGATITGFPPGAVSGGLIYSGGPAVFQAHMAARAVYSRLKSFSALPIASVTEGTLDGFRLGPGVYRLDGAARLSGTLRLDAHNEDHVVFVFQIRTTLTTAPGAIVALINPGRGDTVYWQVGGSVTLAQRTSFEGNILARGSVTLNNGASIQCGRVLTLTGAVVMNRNAVSIACASPEPPVRDYTDTFITSGISPGIYVPLPEPVGVGSSPEPGTFWLASIGVAVGIAVRLYRSQHSR